MCVCVHLGMYVCLSFLLLFFVSMPVFIYVYLWYIYKIMYYFFGLELKISKSMKDGKIISNI